VLSAATIASSDHRESGSEKTSWASGIKDPPRAYLTHETPQELAELLLTALNKRLAHISDEHQDE
jgi:hypothetical protein